MEQNKLLKRLRRLVGRMNRLEERAEEAWHLGRDYHTEICYAYETVRQRAKVLFERARKTHPSSLLVRALEYDDFGERCSLPLPDYDFNG